MSYDFESALLELLRSGQGIALNVILTPSEKVISLERQISVLQQEIKSVERQVFDAHRRYREAVLLNERLFSWLSDNNIKAPEEETHRAMLYFKQTDPNEWK